jgi:hypothetical protein
MNQTIVVPARISCADPDAQPSYASMKLDQAAGSAGTGGM